MLDILDALADEGEASLGELTKLAAAPRASVHRLLVALEERGYVQHVAADAVYRVGPAVRRLASRTIESSLVRLAAPALVDLRATTGETINLAVLDGARIVYAATLEGTRQPHMSSVVGSEAEPHATALGKAILSKLDPGARERILPSPPFPQYTKHTITSPDTLTADLQAAARRGFAVENEESTLSAACIAVPILDTDGAAIAAISISGVTGRLPPATHKRFAADIKAWTEKIQRQLASGATSTDSLDSTTATR